ncbi:hypothetical protein IAQ61_000302 [Plenodomus lingam]|uniref:uncharacterized protein n=1 Tax=Leptosphaeria maculans TaxID=5022 RepID=UPI00332DD5F4|nr:hypothetical protein IAQ61_000302 [Plenodomus lingam]
MPRACQRSKGSTWESRQYTVGQWAMGTPTSTVVSVVGRHPSQRLRHEHVFAARSPSHDSPAASAQPEHPSSHASVGRAKPVSLGVCARSTDPRIRPCPIL